MLQKPNVTRSRRRWISLASATGIGLLSGCAHYAPVPLAETPPLRRDWQSLEGSTPADGHGASIEALVALVLRNNPDLLAARRKRVVAQAQLLQAGLLPNPSVGGALLPLISGPGTVTAWNIGITEDIKSL